MKYPERKHRVLDTQYRYYDSVDVEQEDGNIAFFTWHSELGDDEWRFTGYKDKFGLHIAKEGSDLDFITSNECPRDIMHNYPNFDELVEFYNSNGEIVKFYCYGGALSMRAGIFTTDADGNVKRYKQTAMS